MGSIYIHTVYQLARSITNLEVWIQKYCTYIAYEMLYNDISKIKLPVGFSFLEKLEWGKKKYVLLKYEAIQYTIHTGTLNFSTLFGSDLQ